MKQQDTTTSKYLKVQISFFALGSEGALDFGKFAAEKLKTKKDPADLESKNNSSLRLFLIPIIEVPVYNQIADDQKYGEMVFKGVTRFETLDFEALVNFFTFAVTNNLID